DLSLQRNSFCHLAILLDMTYFFAASIVRAKGFIQSAIYVALCSFAFRSTQKNQRTPEVLVSISRSG
ncbi:hypothetical protein, partial [Bradyrhizobium genosp. SA-3]|uniref:hypothetical protein n=1 Tax=Bradyrhizobium genosp. SA-3 TaxID=508868 RepID=UPI001ABFAAEA